MKFWEKITKLDCLVIVVKLYMMSVLIGDNLPRTVMIHFKDTPGSEQTLVLFHMNNPTKQEDSLTRKWHLNYTY